MTTRGQALLNYTTTVDVHRSVGEITGMLVTHGARSIMTDYDERGNPVAIRFLVPTQYGETGFALPANSEAVLKVLTRQKSAGKVPPRFVTREQAHRVAWRILKDWLEAQLAIIESEMVTIDQVMLPYRVEPDGRSLYQVIVDDQVKLLKAGAE